jgi:hypothetical protein
MRRSLCSKTSSSCRSDCFRHSAGGASGNVRAIQNSGAVTVLDPVPSPTFE